MTPFSYKLRSLRESRGALQKSLAQEIGVSAAYLSALEKGRRTPPHNREFFKKLQHCLELSSTELDELMSSAKATHALGPLVVGTSPMQLEVAIDFAGRLTLLQPKHLRAIKAILELTEQPIKASLI